MTKKKLTLITFIVIFVQMTIMPFFSFMGIIPQLALLWTIFLATRAENLEAILLSLLMGIFFDISFSTVFGVHSILYLLVAFILSNERIKTMENTWYNNVLIIVMGTVLFHFLMGITLYFFGHEINITYIVKHLFTIEIIESVIIGIPFYRLMDKQRVKSLYEYRM